MRISVNSAALVCTLALLGLSTQGCSEPPRRVQAPEQALPVVARVHAFARLYGYVRYFHPSDEAALVDWDRFAMYGVARAMRAADRDELIAELRTLFGPIAPTVRIRAQDQPAEALVLPPRQQDTVLLAWQHHGVGMDPLFGYRSLRLGRRSENPAMLDGASQLIFNVPPTSQQVRLSAWVKANVSDAGSGGRLSMSARGGGRLVF